nr:hypothetical protein [Tanacetum cinerariifolium]
MLGQQLELAGNENENIPLYYHIVDNFYIQFGREEFCLVSGLKFGVKIFTDYNKAKDPIPFRRRVFSSDLDGRPIRGNDVLLLIESDVFRRLEDNDAVSLCCVCILQLVLLGIEDRRPVPNWILRLANDIVSWDNYPWGSYVWPTLYKHLRDANVKRWQPLYASEPANETDTKTYSIEGFAWAFKGQLPVERLVSDETEARSRWGYQQMKEKNVDMYEKLTRFMEDMRRVPEAHTTPIITDQHFGVSDMSGFQSYQSNWLSLSNWKTPNQSYLGTPNSQPPIPSQPGTSNWQNPMPSRRQDAGILDPVYIPINAEGVHWVTRAINLTDLIFYVFDSMESESRMLLLEQQVNN